MHNDNSEKLDDQGMVLLELVIIDSEGAMEKMIANVTAKNPAWDDEDLRSGMIRAEIWGFVTYLQKAFVWHDTPEGYNYWWNLANKIVEAKKEVA